MTKNLFSGDRLLFLDGGMGTQLQAKGLQPGEIPELWNVTRPADVRAVHEAYFEAGANVVYTNTFGASPAKYHGDAPLADVIEAAVGIEQFILVAGVDGVHEVQVAFEEFQKYRVSVDDESHSYGVEIGETVDFEF